jgi:hypothetical protein
MASLAVLLEVAVITGGTPVIIGITAAQHRCRQCQLHISKQAIQKQFLHIEHEIDLMLAALESKQIRTGAPVGVFASNVLVPEDEMAQLISFLTSEDRDWLKKHGWEPPLRRISFTQTSFEKG